ncbi:MAG: hypothetical protein KDA65_07810 [Planctomycetaceae bacterium]|nr:hypothetical protein [Planctomycetaceae bacterium]
MRFSDYIITLLYFSLSIALAFLVTILDQPRFQLGLTTFGFSFVFSLIGNLANRLALAKWLPILGFFFAIILQAPQFNKIQHELAVFKIVAALCLNLTTSLLIFRVAIKGFNNFIPQRKEAKPISLIRILSITTGIVAVTVGTALYQVELAVRFALIVAGVLSWLIMLYHFTFMHILHSSPVVAVDDLERITFYPSAIEAT